MLPEAAKTWSTKEEMVQFSVTDGVCHFYTLAITPSSDSTCSVTTKDLQELEIQIWFHLKLEIFPNSADDCLSSSLITCLRLRFPPLVFLR